MKKIVMTHSQALNQQTCAQFIEICSGKWWNLENNDINIAIKLMSFALHRFEYKVFFLSLFFEVDLQASNCLFDCLLDCHTCELVQSLSLEDTYVYVIDNIVWKQQFQCYRRLCQCVCVCMKTCKLMRCSS